MILLTGAGGFIGRALRRRLTETGHIVLALKHADSFVPTAGEIALDLDNPLHYSQLTEVGARCGTLIHLAGRISIQLASTEDDDVRPRATAARLADLYQGNLVMTARLLEVAQTAGIQHVVFASSQSVYGLPATMPVAEDAPLAPLEYYAASKVACETALQLWARGTRRKVTVLRIPGVWGPGRPDGLVHSLCEQSVRHRRVRVGADYPLALDVLHIDDVVSAFEAALERLGDGWRVYNVATGEPCSVTRLGREISDLVPGCVVENFGVPQPDIALDVGRAARELHWSAQPRSERLRAFLRQVSVESHHA